MSSIAGIILAAGASRRMGQPKQLLHVNGQSMVNRTAEIAQQAGCEPVIVVLGAHRDLIAPQLSREVHTVFNPDWEGGMGSSVATGLRKALELSPKLKASTYLLTDQPYLTTTVLENLIQAALELDQVGAVCTYNGHRGVPAVFKASTFDTLLKLKGEKGAKSIIRRYRDNLAVVPFPNGDFDLDYPEDWAFFQRSRKEK